MSTASRSLTMLAVILIVFAGCRTMTGRGAGEWIDDKTTTARVKAAVGSAQLGALTRVNIDTSRGRVFVTGVTANEAERQRILAAARGAAAGKPVTSHLVLSTDKRDVPAPAASPRTQASGPATSIAPEPSHLSSFAAPPKTPLKFSRLEPEAPSYGRFAAYDDAGRRVATIYTLPLSDLQAGLPTLDAGNLRIDHIAIYPHSGGSEPHYHIVLWHVSRQQARTLE